MNFLKLLFVIPFCLITVFSHSQNKEEIDSILKIGKIRKNIGDYSNAKEDGFKVLDITKNDELSEKRAMAFDLLANINKSENNFSKALEKLDEAKAIRKKTKKLHKSYTNIGNMYLLMIDHNNSLLKDSLSNLALSNHMLAFTELKKQNSNFISTKFYLKYLNIGSTFIKLNELDSAKNYLNMALNCVNYFKKDSVRICKMIKVNLAMFDLNLAANNENEAKKLLGSTEIMLDTNNIDKLYWSIFSEREMDYLEKYHLGPIARQISRYRELRDTMDKRHNLKNSVRLEKIYKNEKLRTEKEEVKLSSQIKTYAIIGILFFLSILIFFFQKLRKSYAQIEILMKEMHHRIKNNLQVLASLFSLQAMKEEKEQTKSLLIENNNRVQAMTLLHQRLYTGNQSVNVRLNEYIEKLVEEIESSFEVESNVIEKDFIIPTIEIDAEKATSLAMILNELITNSFKYAFDSHKSPRLSIYITQENSNTLKVIVADNGKTTTKREGGTEFGSKMIKLFSKQLKVSVDVSTEFGYKYTLTIKNLRIHSSVK